MGVCEDVLARTKNMEVSYRPILGWVCVCHYGVCVLCQVPSQGDKCLLIILGILQFPLPGVGMIIHGIIYQDWANLCIGLMQLFIPFVGWLWGWLWGALIIIKALQSS